MSSPESKISNIESVQKKHMGGADINALRMLCTASDQVSGKQIEKQETASNDVIIDQDVKKEIDSRARASLKGSIEVLGRIDSKHPSYDKSQQIAERFKDAYNNLNKGDYSHEDQIKIEGAIIFKSPYDSILRLEEREMELIELADKPRFNKIAVDTGRVDHFYEDLYEFASQKSWSRDHMVNNIFSQYELPDDRKLAIGDTVRFFRPGGEEALHKLLQKTQEVREKLGMPPETLIAANVEEFSENELLNELQEMLRQSREKE